MNSREYWGLAEAYAEVYASEETEQLDEMGQVMTTGQRTAPKAAPRTPQPYRPGGGRQAYNQRRSGITQTAKPAPTSKPTATAPTSKPTATAPTARPAAPADRPTATAPTSRPAAPTAKSSPAPTAKPVTQPPESRTQASAGEIRGMIGRSMERQAASTPASKPTPTAPARRSMGSRKPGSIVSGLDMFDLVKGYLLDEGYADTEEAAIKIMANMSEEWKNTIISNL
jgi:hypothetical protein